MHRIKSVVAAIAMIVVCGPVLAAGPVNGEVGIMFWPSDTEVGVGDVSASEGSDAFGGRAELWFKRFGASGQLFQPEISNSGGSMDLEYINLDLKYRVFSPAQHNFVALGAGWQSIDIDGLDTSGPRLLVEGQVGFLGTVYGYGRAAYLAQLADVEEAGITLFEDGTGYQLELGVGVEPMPLLSLWAGFQLTDVDFEIPLVATDFSLQTGGVLAGVGIHF